MVLQDAAGLAQPAPDRLRVRGRGHPAAPAGGLRPRGPQRGRPGGRGALGGGPAPAGAALPALPPRAVRRPEAAGADRRVRWRCGPGCWSPTSRSRRLDASIRGEILALLLGLRDDLGLGILVVTHDLGLAWNIADRIAVMYLGRVVECGTTEEVLESPRHPYTRALLSVVPEIERIEPVVLSGRDPGPHPHPGRMPVPPPLPRAGRRQRRPRRRHRPLPRHRRSTCCPPPVTTGSPATSTLPAVPDALARAVDGCHHGGQSDSRVSNGSGRTGGVVAESLQQACRGRCTSTTRPGARAGRRAVRRVVLRRPPRRPRADRAVARGRGRRGGESRAGHQRRGRPAARGVQRVPAPRLAAASRSTGRAGPHPAGVRRLGPALPLPLVDLRPRRPAAARAARRRGARPRRVLAQPGRGRHLGRVRLRPPLARSARRRWRTRSPGRPPAWPTTGSAGWSPAR